MNFNDSKMKKEQRYLYAPTKLLTGLLEEPKAVLTDILIYGIYYNSQKMKFDTYDKENYLIAQFIYDYVKNINLIPEFLTDSLEELDFEADFVEKGKIGFDNEGNFDADEEIRRIKELSNDNSCLLDSIFEYSRVKVSIDFKYKRIFTIQ